MNEANCNVIQDILPLYLDNAVSEDTAKMVEEHLHTCKECMEYKKKMEADIVVTENNECKKLLRKINGRVRKNCYKCCCCNSGSCSPDSWRNLCI